MTEQELLKTDEFRTALENDIDFYNNRPLPKKGQYYKRTPYDELKARDMFTFTELRKEYVRVQTKNSNLSSSLRQAVVAIVQDAEFKAYNKIQAQQQEHQQEEEQAAKAAIPKKKRTRKKQDSEDKK